MSELVPVLVAAWREWREEGAGRQGAALAFYALFALAPLLVVATSIAGGLLGEEAAAQRLSVQLQVLFTPLVADAVQHWVADAAHGPFNAAGMLGLGASVFAGTRGFLHLQGTLDQMWGVRQVRGPGPKEFVRRRLLAFASATLCATLLLTSLLTTAALHGVSDYAKDQLPENWLLLRGIHEAITFSVVALLLAIVFKTLPDAVIGWADVAFGALVTALLFLVGQQAIAWYLAEAGVSSSFGAAGSAIAVLLYCYYSAQVLLFGAKLTAVRARHLGRPPVPRRDAARVVRQTIRE